MNEVPTAWILSQLAKHWNFSFSLEGDDKSYVKSNIVAGRVVGYMIFPGTDNVNVLSKVSAVLWNKDLGKNSLFKLYDPATTLTIATANITSQIPVLVTDSSPVNWPAARSLLEIQLLAPGGGESRMSALEGLQ